MLRAIPGGPRLVPPYAAAVTVPDAHLPFVHRRWPWWAASLALVLGLFVSSTLGWQWLRDQREQQEHRSALDGLWLEQTIRATLDQHLHILGNWAHDVAPPTPAALADFTSRIDGLMKEYPALLAIDCLDRHGHRLAGLPAYVTSTERPRHLPPLNDPLIASAIERARTLEQPEYSKVIEQNAPLWVLAVPITDDSSNHGTLIATYDLDRLLEQEVPWWFVQRYDLALVDRQNKRLSPRDGALPADLSANGADRQQLGFGPPDSGLALWTRPHPSGHPSALLAGLAAAVVAFGLLIVGLLRLLQRWLRERLTAQLALADALRFRQAMENSLLTALVAFGRDGRIIYANPALGRMLGLDSATLVGTVAPFAFWPAEQRAECAAAHDAMMRGDSPPLGQALTLQRADGSLLPARLFASPLVGSDRKPRGWMASLHDTSAEHEAARVARERDELLQRTARLASLAEFASGIAHELNQPLAAIANYAAVADSVLSQDPPVRGKAEDAVARIGEEARRAGRIVQSLRGFIQKRQVEHRRHAMRSLLTEPLLLLEPLAQRLRVRVGMQADGDPEIDCDGVMIEQVLVNLLRNALESLPAADNPGQHPPPPDAVTVRLRAEDGHVIVSVADRGRGLADPAQLFQPFYTTKSDGMGLGLAICRTVIESHGGRLWAETREGGGTCFHFRLPLAGDTGPLMAATVTPSPLHSPAE
ncbi:MAG TPA: ATP-binding protein [Ideonella sp.]|uniref:sensor histidine kinase n=1 Tax=Ideonella sp. TaxID=1929293 RepID=UPI002E32C839|nr:ATP-binding protein [Ideonella sp.]HEX5685424.1 ATP-binding protein [Ideonella sp.]